MILANILAIMLTVLVVLVTYAIAIIIDYWPIILAVLIISKIVKKKRSKK